WPSSPATGARTRRSHRRSSSPCTRSRFISPASTRSSESARGRSWPRRCGRSGKSVRVSAISARGALAYRRRHDELRETRARGCRRGRARGDRAERGDRGGAGLTYSARIRHRLDRDGRYPFAVAGYRIRWVGAARGRSLVLALREKAKADPGARPSIRYRPTRSKPVLSAAGTQAVRQVFRRVRAHRHLPAAATVPTSRPASPTTTTTTTTPASTPATSDADHDGTPDSRDCAAHDPAVHPGAPDLPDIGFVDSNCDGIDGTESDAIFVSPAGSDANPGTRSRPKRQIEAAVLAAAGTAKYVLAAAG